MFIRTFKIYIIFKLLTFGEVLVFLAKVTRETVQPLVAFSFAVSYAGMVFSTPMTNACTRKSG
jgi:hypothetical protein